MSPVLDLGCGVTLETMYVTTMKGLEGGVTLTTVDV